MTSDSPKPSAALFLAEGGTVVVKKETSVKLPKDRQVGARRPPHFPLTVRKKAEIALLLNMQVRVLLFGAARERVGQPQIALDIADGSLSSFWHALYERYPLLREIDSLFVSVNQQYASETVQLREHDEIALLPAVSGG